MIESAPRPGQLRRTAPLQSPDSHQFTGLGARAQRWLQRGNAGPASKSVARLAAAHGRRRIERRGPVVTGLPVIMVGGLSVGGAGKTPVVMWLARRLHMAGRAVAVVARGHGGSRGAVRRVRVAESSVVGDEAAMMRRALPEEIPVWVGADRARCVEAARRGGRVVVVDDGWLCPQTPRGAEIVVLDAGAPASVWPAGPLRCAPEAIPPGSLRWLHKVDEARGERWEEAGVRSALEPLSLIDPAGVRWPASHLRGRKISACCAIGRPSSFFHTLSNLGAELVHCVEGLDHEVLSARHLRSAREAAALCVTTAKDAARMAPGHGLWVLEVGVSVVAGVERVDALLAKLER